MTKEEQVYVDRICNQARDYETGLLEDMKNCDNIIDDYNFYLNDAKKLKENNDNLLNEYQEILSKYNVNLKEYILLILSSGLLAVPVWGNVIPNINIGLATSLLTGACVGGSLLIKDKVKQITEVRKFKYKNFGIKDVTDSEMEDIIKKREKAITEKIDLYEEVLKTRKTKRQEYVDKLNEIDCEKRINLSTLTAIKNIVESYTEKLDDGKRKKFVDDLTKVYEYEMRNSYQKKYR